MTKKECLKNIKSMLPDIDKYIMKESERLLNSGGINIENDDKESFRPAKIVLTVALKSLSSQYQPLDEANRKEMKNLSCF